MTRNLRRRTSLMVALGCLTMGPLAAPATPAARSGRASRQALAFFVHAVPDARGTFLDALRPVPLAAVLRAQVMASLPVDGEVQPSREEADKLATIEPVLRYHHRRDVLQLKLITVGQAFVGLHARTVLLVSREALVLLSGPQLAALIGHEIAHEYFWDEYQAALARDDRDKVRELELRCDGVAVMTLRELGLDPHALAEAVKALTRFNQTVGAVATAGLYVSLKERIAFIDAMDHLVTTPDSPPAARRARVGASPRSAYDRPLDALDVPAVARAKAAAARRLEDPECLKVLTEFTDGEGRALDRSLETWGMSAADYVLALPFRDGAAMPHCRRASVVLVTIPGLPAIYLCPRRLAVVRSLFTQTEIQDPALAEAMVIHEMLHTLGLGENPPSSLEITERVRTHCR